MKDEFPKFAKTTQAAANKPQSLNFPRGIGLANILA